jgi:hypothetical protein
VGGVGFMGLTWVILAVILVHDRSIRDGGSEATLSFLVGLEGLRVRFCL